jgi:hypothetical protein
MICEKQAIEMYDKCRNEILHRARSERNDSYFDVLFTDVGEVCMIRADLRTLFSSTTKPIFLGNKLLSS